MKLDFLVANMSKRRRFIDPFQNFLRHFGKQALRLQGTQDHQDQDPNKGFKIISYRVPNSWSDIPSLQDSSRDVEGQGSLWIVSIWLQMGIDSYIQIDDDFVCDPPHTILLPDPHH